MNIHTKRNLELTENIRTKEKKYSLSAGQYFDVKIEYVELSQDEFNARMSAYAEKLQEYFAEGDKLKTEIMEQLKKVKYE